MERTLYYTSKGIPVEVGRELGKGGEGKVFEVPGPSNQAAKIYERLDPKKHAKLALKLPFMAASPDACDSQFLSYVAWPQDTLHHGRGGPVVGFLMPKISGKEAIHMVYSPAHRKQDYPKAGFDFLLAVARNIAATIQSIHSHGYVIGDINPNSFFVGRDAKVVIIDSDSFQVNVQGTMHLCDVGVAHFTPPELQAITSFDGVTRTTNHDNFGLALLLFHVLFGGRHPFSGVPLRKDVGNALETDIKNFRYAYARDNLTRGFNPPPKSIPVSILPDAVESMFHLAFTEKGAAGNRPSAQQWVAALDGVRGRLKKCSATSMHVYPDHLGSCPWCALETQGVVYFIGLGKTFTPTKTGFVLSQVWASIQSISALPSFNIPTPDSFSVTAQVLPVESSQDGTFAFYRALAVGLGIAIAIVEPKAMFWGIMVGIIGWLMASSASSSERTAKLSRRMAERSRRIDIHKAAYKEYEELDEQLRRNMELSGLDTKLAELTRLRNEYQALPQVEKQELDYLRFTAQERQKQKFLDTCFIDSASISGVGPTRKAALRSFGIETAADVSRSKVMQVRGFGDNLTRAVIDWKASCERLFVFNPTNAVSAVDRDAVLSKLDARKIRIEVAMTQGLGELQSLRQQSINNVAALQPRLEAAAKKLSQAQADLTVF